MPYFKPDPSMDSGNRAGRAWYHLFGGLALGFYALFIWRCAFWNEGKLFFTLFDDAMISMRYAQNLAAGHGLVWNPGGPAVEGYTNPLWTLVMAVLHLLPLPESKICLVVSLIGAAVLLVNLLVVRSLARRVTANSFAVGLASFILVAFYYPLIFWTLRGMEVGIMTLFLNLAILLALDLAENFRPARVGTLCLVFAAALETRPDALVGNAIIAFFLVLRSSPSRRLFLAAALALANLIPLAGHTWLRWIYYGDVLPNTYYLKMTGIDIMTRIGRGLYVLKQSALVHFLPILLPLAFVLGLKARRRELAAISPAMWLLASVFLGQAAYSVYVGGDAWEWFFFANRYLCMAVPALMVFFCNLTLPELARGAAFRHAALKWGLFPALILAGAVAVMAGANILSRQGAIPLVMGRFNQYQFFRGMSLIIGGAVFFSLALFVVKSGQIAAFLKHGLTGAGSVLGFGLTCLVFCLLLNVTGYLPWLADGGYEVKDNAGWTRLGLFLRQNTSAKARLAMTAAGSPPYFARRECIDLLGKTDKLIAKGPAAGEFWPGHNKWNYARSIGQLKPDVVTNLWGGKEQGEKYLQAIGYRKMPNGLYVHKDSQAVNRAGIGRLWNQDRP